MTFDNGVYFSVEEDVTVSFSVGMGGGSNILGIVSFSIVLGLMIGRMGEKGKPLVHLFALLQHAVIKMVRLIIWSVNFQYLYRL